MREDSENSVSSGITSTYHISEIYELLTSWLRLGWTIKTLVLWVRG